jgi:hypothetical protein
MGAIRRALAELRLAATPTGKPFSDDTAYDGLFSRRDG